MRAITDMNEVIRVDFDVAGSYSVALVTDARWSLASVRAGAVVGSRDMQVEMKAARSLDGGAVEARAVTTRERRKVIRTIDIDPDGSWSSRYRDNRRAGVQIVGEASGGGHPGGDSRMTRRRLDRRGDEVWTLSATTRARRHGGATSGPISKVTTSTVNYAGGGQGTSRVLIYTGEDKWEKSQWRTVPSAPGTTTVEKTTTNEDGSKTTTRITDYGTGTHKTETTNTSENRASDGSRTTDSTKNTTEWTSGGIVSTSSEKEHIECRSPRGGGGRRSLGKKPPKIRPAPRPRNAASRCFRRRNWRMASSAERSLSSTPTAQ